MTANNLTAAPAASTGGAMPDMAAYKEFMEVQHLEYELFVDRLEKEVIYYG